VKVLSVLDLIIDRLTVSVADPDFKLRGGGGGGGRFVFLGAAAFFSLSLQHPSLQLCVME